MTRRRAIVLGGVLAAIVLAIVVQPKNPSAPSASRTPAAQPVVVAPPAPKPRSKQHSRRALEDPNDSDPRVRARVREEIARRPAMQHLPYDGEGISIILTGELSHGKTVLAVSYRGTRAGAHKAYRGFLYAAGDSGRGYLPRFRREHPSRGMTG